VQEQRPKTEDQRPYKVPSTKAKGPNDFHHPDLAARDYSVVEQISVCARFL
jgi:hypothetical protein